MGKLFSIALIEKENWQADPRVKILYAKLKGF